ncbi:MAG: hypothetical protein G01um101416_261 [Microgenomates group bacterium Gr01-1014_16]|nr:MAG: hypothetical protein G01um101416_261 [Microgenomates group bacterium Gr01-1014_16]
MRWGIVLAIVGVLLVAQWKYVEREAENRMVNKDFGSFFRAAVMWKSGAGERLYDLEEQKQWQGKLFPEAAESQRVLPMFYLPVAVLILVPLTGWGVEIAYRVWAGINVVMTVGWASWMAGGRGIAETWKGLGRGMLVIIGVMIFPPMVVNWLHGRFDGWLAMAMWGVAELARRNKIFWAGVVMSLMLVKPHLLMVLVLMWTVKKETRFLGGVVVGILGLMVVSWYMVGWTGLVGWMTLGMKAVNLGETYGLHSQLEYSWSGLVAKLQLGDAVWLVGVTVVMIVGFLVWRGKWRVDSEELDLRWALAILLALFTSRHVNYSDLTLLLVVVFLSARGLMMKLGETRGVFLALGMIGVVGALQIGPAWYAILELVGIIVLAGAILLEGRLH